MNRKLLSTSMAAVAGAILICAESGTAQDFVPRDSTVAVADGVFLMVTERAPDVFVNSVLIRDGSAALLVDHPGDPMTLEASDDLGERFRRRLSDLGGPPTTLVNSHWHGDHTGGNVRIPDVRIISHANASERLRVRQEPFWKPDGVGPLPPEGWPDVLVRDSMVVEVGSRSLILHHFGPAHTDGDLVVMVPDANIVYVGDLFVTPERPSFGNDMEGLSRVLRAIHERIDDETRILSGHGPVSNREDLGRYTDMLTATIEHVRRQLNQGGTLQSIVAEGLPDEWTGTIDDPAAQQRWLWEMMRSLTGTFPGRRP